MITPELLASVPYFSELSEDLLLEVCATCDLLDIPAGTVLIEEGSPAGDMYVLLEGELIVTSTRLGPEVELARLGPGEIVGETALLEGATRTATVTSVSDTKVLMVSAVAFEELLADPRVARRMFLTAVRRLRSTEDTLRHSVRMAALGQMAAQLMHELNNPAAAVGRSTAELVRVQEALVLELQNAGFPVLTERGPGPPVSDPLTRSRQEETLASWLSGNGVEQPWDLAPALVAAGFDVDTLARLADGHDPETIRILGLAIAANQLLDEIGLGARRISELVRVVKEYSYLDQAPVQDLVVTAGIDDTLVLLRHKLRDIQVTTRYEEDLHTVTAPGRELNQVWTNLIDNAADAMADGGSLTIEASNDDDSVVVRMSDTGPGIPDDTMNKIFDPFFTTKEPGKGTGLGLHTVHTILAKVGGSITVESAPTGTTFTVRLPRMQN